MKPQSDFTLFKNERLCGFDFVFLAQDLREWGKFEDSFLRAGD